MVNISSGRRTKNRTNKGEEWGKKKGGGGGEDRRRSLSISNRYALPSHWKRKVDTKDMRYDRKKKINDGDDDDL